MAQEGPAEQLCARAETQVNFAVRAQPQGTVSSIHCARGRQDRQEQCARTAEASSLSAVRGMATQGKGSSALHPFASRQTKTKPKPSLKELFRKFISAEVARIGKANVLALSKTELYRRFVRWRRRGTEHAVGAKKKRSLKVLFRQFIDAEVARVGKDKVMALSKSELYSRFLRWRKRGQVQGNCGGNGEENRRETKAQFAVALQGIHRRGDLSGREGQSACGVKTAALSALPGLAQATRQVGIWITCSRTNAVVGSPERTDVECCS